MLVTQIVLQKLVIQLDLVLVENVPLDTFVLMKTVVQKINVIQQTRWVHVPMENVLVAILVEEVSVVLFKIYVSCGDCRKY